MLRYPNRTGEIGTYSAGVVTLSGQALPGMRSFVDAQASARIDRAADTVGVSIKALSSPDLWIVGIAEYDWSEDTLTLVVVEDESATALGADTLVEVTAVATDGMLQGMTYAAPEYAYGPPAWTAGDNALWEPFMGYWRLTGVSAYITLVPSAATAALRPATFSVDFFRHPDAVNPLDWAPPPGFILQYGGGSLQVEAEWAETGWQTLSGTVSGQTGDITQLLLQVSYQDGHLYRYRNLIATE